MTSKRVVSALVALMLFSIPAFAADVTALDPANVVLVKPDEAPVSIASFDGVSDGKKVSITVAFRNETKGPIEGAQVAMMVFDGKRNVIGKASHRTAGHAKPGGTFQSKFEIPLMKPLDDAWQIVVVPVSASFSHERGWRVPKGALQPLVDRLERGNWSGAQQALAIGRDFVPRGELVQMVPPNCTIMECHQHYEDCYFFCGPYIACAYCDRRRTWEGCSTTCYCVWGSEPCPDDPYHDGFDPEP
jgi:hypothetical protein